MLGADHSGPESPGQHWSKDKRYSFIAMGSTDDAANGARPGPVTFPEFDLHPAQANRMGRAMLKRLSVDRNRPVVVLTPQEAFDKAVRKCEAIAQVIKHEEVARHAEHPDWISLKAALAFRRRFAGVTIKAAVRALQQDVDYLRMNAPRWKIYVEPDESDAWVTLIKRSER